MNNRMQEWAGRELVIPASSFDPEVRERYLMDEKATITLSPTVRIDSESEGRIYRFDMYEGKEYIGQIWEDSLPLEFRGRLP